MLALGAPALARSATLVQQGASTSERPLSSCRRQPLCAVALAGASVAQLARRRLARRRLSLRSSGEANAASPVEDAWEWRGHRVRSVRCEGKGKKPHIVLVHGFGGSVEYWRRTMPALCGAGYTVHAFDLLGLGLSEKPAMEYSIQLWAEQVADFVQDLGEEVVLVGNSFGSLISLTAARRVQPKGIVMINCAVGMNNKNMVKTPSFSDLQRFLAKLALGFVDLIFKSPILDVAFANLATTENVSGVLKNLYPTNPSAVDDELAQGFVRPAETPGALEVLRQIYTGDPGLTPMELFEADETGFKDLPFKVIWGEQDTLTPLEGAVGSFLQTRAKESSNINFQVIQGGHIPHDENPQVVNEALLNWLDSKPWA